MNVLFREDWVNPQKCPDSKLYMIRYCQNWVRNGTAGLIVLAVTACQGNPSGTNSEYQGLRLSFWSVVPWESSAQKPLLALTSRTLN